MNLSAVWRSSNRLFVIVAALIVAVLVSDVVTAATKGGSRRTAAASNAVATPSTTPSPVARSGEIVLYNDDFDDPGTGWANEKTKSGSSFRYVRGRYVVVLKDRLADEFLYAPGIPATALKADMTVAQTAGFSNGSGLGMLCTQTDGKAAIAYDFLLLRASASTVHWVIRLRDGLPNKHDKETDLTKGDLHVAIGPKPLKLSIQCLTKADDRTTNLVFTVDGRQVGHAHNTVAKDLPRGAWRSGLVVSNRAGSTTVTATHFDMSSVALSAL